MIQSGNFSVSLPHSRSLLPLFFSSLCSLALGYRAWMLLGFTPTTRRLHTNSLFLSVVLVYACLLNSLSLNLSDPHPWLVDPEKRLIGLVLCVPYFPLPSSMDRFGPRCRRSMAFRPCSRLHSPLSRLFALRSSCLRPRTYPAYRRSSSSTFEYFLSRRLRL
jgi:hypothetical protein